MADSDVDRQRRHRAHAVGDHRMCKPEHCRDAGTGPPPAPPEPVWASGADLPDRVEEAIRGDIEAMGELHGVEGSLAAIALKLGQAIDKAGEPRELAALSREARSTLTDLTLSLNPPARPSASAARPAGRASEESNDDGWFGMDVPV